MFNMGVLQVEEVAEYGEMQRQPRQGCSSYTVSAIFIMNVQYRREIFS